MTTKSKNYKVTGSSVLANTKLPAHSASTVLPSAWGHEHNPIEAKVVYKRGYALAAAILLNSLAEPLQYVDEPTMEERFKSKIRSLEFANFWNWRYPRKYFEEKVEKLKGFQFNKQSPLETLLTAPFRAAVNLEKGRAIFSIPNFIPNRDISWPGSNMSCRIKTTLTGVDLDTGSFRTVCSYSPLFDKKMKTRTDYEAINDLPFSDYPLLIYCCGIDFFLAYGKNHLVRLPEAKYNPMGIVAVKFKDGKNRE